MKQVQKPKKPLVIYYLIAFIVLILLNWFVFPMFMGSNVTEVDYGTFLNMIEERQVSKVQLEGDTIFFMDKSEEPQQYETTTFDDPELVNRLEEAGCEFGRVAQEQMNPILSMLISIVIPVLIFWGLGQLLTRQMMKKMGGGSGNQFMQFGKSNAKVYVESTTGITFNDVAGEDEAKELLTEIVDFLHNPGKYQEIGAVCPKGALLVGPPGTGKTLLAKAQEKQMFLSSRSQALISWRCSWEWALPKCVTFSSRQTRRLPASSLSTRSILLARKGTARDTAEMMRGSRP